eukprot:3499956-Pleurochrysis_carterae.AAC.2
MVNALREYLRRNAGPEPNPEPAPAPAAKFTAAAGVQTRCGGVHPGPPAPSPSPANNAEQALAPFISSVDRASVEADRLRPYDIAQQGMCLALFFVHTTA